LSKCIRQARSNAKKEVKIAHGPVEKIVITEDTASVTSEKLLHNQIKDTELSFDDKIIEFRSLFIFENLINEFQKLTDKDELVNKVEIIFAKLSKKLNINKNNKLVLLDFINIFKTLEKKVSSKNFSSIILEVSK
jgi:hypothetical protein